MTRPKSTESASYAGSVRDAIGDALSRFPCSRLQAAYQPETGGLEVRGHVPDTALRTDVVAMLERSVGGSIPIGGSLLVLPQPQCDVLNAVEELGFPQSVDQANDPLVVGEQAQAEILEFEDGRSVDFGMQAPEFDADIYVDYYDGDGNVLHLLPNEYTQDNRLPANSHFTIGDRETSGTRFTLRVGPPFGQDILVIVGATRPLYDGLRPLVEEAAGYLAWLHDRIETFQRDDPDFQGEWVYLFVKTGPTGAFTAP